MSIKKLFLAIALYSICNASLTASGLTSFDTEAYTINKVRIANFAKESVIVGSSYYGTILCMSYDGTVRWTHKLSGFMNHDLWCGDITGDGKDEVLAANADGSLYCIDSDGRLKWRFKRNDAPMYSVCTIKRDGVPYVVCGGLDKELYYLSASGKMIKKIHSRTYSKERTWGKGTKRIPPKGIHTVNFVRKQRGREGKDILVVHGVTNSNSSAGSLYLFKPLADKPYRIIKLKNRKPYGELRMCDTDGDGIDEVLLGASSMIHNAAYTVVSTEAGKQVTTRVMEMKSVKKKLDRFGYRVMQPEVVRIGKENFIMLLFGSRILIQDIHMKSAPEVLSSRYSFNDMWWDPRTGSVILASCQSGGSCIHILDLKDSGWKKAYQSISPPGKIAKILQNTKALNEQLSIIKKPVDTPLTSPVYFMTETIPTSLNSLIDSIHKTSRSPVFLTGKLLPSVENWDRSGLTSEKYRKRRDSRKRYTKSSDEIVEIFKPLLKKGTGVAYWGGHGNDPFMISLKTQKRIIDAAKGKTVVTIYPELTDSSDDFKVVMNDLIYPLAEHCRGKNAKIYVRTKHLFWQTAIYRPLWSRLMSGEFSDVFVPSMEETTDKSMELSLAARMGLWTSGAVDDWGSRCARDNPSFDRLRQHSHQMLPNHFLRCQVYTIASGARYINNFAVDQEYMSVLWKLIAKGILFAPKREDIISFSPVSVSMIDPDDSFAEDGNNVKWRLFYDETFDKENSFVFSRLNGTWPGAPVTEWDFSRYAAGVKDRRLNFLPPYPNGMVLIPPAQNGERKKSPPNRLHPLYKNIIKEYVTDGRYYYSPDGKKQVADTYYKTVERDIIESAKKIPITVSGNVAWVASVISPSLIRLTLIDSGYINPSDKTAEITFNTVTPLVITDRITGQAITIGGSGTTSVPVPCGLFRFLDIQIKETL